MQNDVTCIRNMVRAADPFVTENANAEFSLRLHQRAGGHGVACFDQFKRDVKVKRLCAIARNIANRRSA